MFQHSFKDTNYLCLIFNRFEGKTSKFREKRAGIVHFPFFQSIEGFECFFVVKNKHFKIFLEFDVIKFPKISFTNL